VLQRTILTNGWPPTAFYLAEGEQR